MKKVYNQSCWRMFTVSFLLIVINGSEGKLFAARNFWSGNASSDWNEPSNWQCNCLPCDGDTLEIKISGNPPVISSLTLNLFTPYGIIVDTGAVFTVSGGIFTVAGSNIAQINSGGTLNISGGTLRITGNGGLQVLEGGTVNMSGGTLQNNGTGNIQINSGAVFNQIGGDISTKGDWENNGSFNASPGSAVIFSGGVNQNIRGNIITTFYNLEINLNNSNCRLHLGVNASVSGTLFLTRGGLLLVGKTLTITNPAPNAIVRTSPGYIKAENNNSGEIKRIVNNNTGTYLFPFGKTEAASDYIPFSFTVETAGSASGLVSISTYGTSQNNNPLPNGVTKLNSGGLLDNSVNVVDRFWIINVEGYSIRPVATLDFTYENGEAPANGEDNLIAQRWNGTEWDDPDLSAPGGQTSDPVGNTVTARGVSNFSPWTLVRKLAPLPVTFLNFETRIENGMVNLFWSTATEINNDYFTVERSENARQFDAVAKIKGRSNSTSVSDYKYRDVGASSRGNNDIIYYRIKQTDFDGKFDYSKIISVKLRDKDRFFSVFPNPTTQKIILLFGRVPCIETIRIAIYDVEGKEHFSESCPCNNGFFENMDIENQLSHGIYFVSATSEFDSYTQRLIVQ